jgi:exopolysaccharide biosynthesis polyprenyl glycosylphosphotransferase
MKKSELLFNAFLVPLDYAMIVLATAAVYFLRFINPIVENYPILYVLQFGRYMEIALISALVVIGVYALEGLYSMKVTRSSLKEILKIFTATSAALMIFIVAVFLDRYLFSSRFILLGSWALIIIFVSIERLLARYLQRRIAKWRGTDGLHRVLMVGGNDIAGKIIHYFRCHPRMPYKVVGRLKEIDKESLKQYKNRIDEVIQCDPQMPISQVNTLAQFCEINRIDFKYVPNLFAARATNIEIRSIAGFPVVEIKRTPLDGWGRVIKRLFDVVASSIMLIILSPVFLWLAIMIKLDSEGSVFVRLKRVSQGKLFRMLKFRSMVKNAHELKRQLMKLNERKDGPLFKMKNDPRITKFGRFLRRTRLDEFAQLFNVLKGEISLVGPRPHEPEEVDQYQTHHRKVMAVKSGITGMAQVSGSSKLGFEEEVGLDTYYIENWSLMLDFVILFKTFLIFIKRDKNAC